MHDDFPALLKKLEQFHTGTVREIVLSSATDRHAAERLLTSAASKPLSAFINATQATLFGLCVALLPTPPEDQKEAKPTGKPMPLGEVYKELFRIATGWLGWPPETAWYATPQEITEAFTGHITKLKAIHGEAEDDDATGPSDEQRKQNTEQGLDPDFDRAGMHALKGLGKL
ncbi:hypothetical protein [Roseovarius litorisediminis]|uniref:hypothetical protein n=1 Tax=Roseovarius litorisediminis TaxID=1312363 RepID=UPI00111BF2A3|nr:hypothetical protein [Roseovarius litorisediminis]